MAKSAPKETKEFDWQLNFNTALEDKDEDLVGSVDQKIYSSFGALTFMFWWKSFIGQQISDAEMRFIRKAKKTHSAVLTKNPNTPISVLELLAKDKDEYVRGEVAANPNTPISVLELLAKDKDEYVQCGVAGNPNTPIPVLEQLANDMQKYVQWNIVSNIAANPNTPISLLELLAKDGKKDVRQSIAQNPNTPIPGGIIAPIKYYSPTSMFLRE